MKPIHFEVASYVMFVLTAIVIALRYRQHRDYWYALKGPGYRGGIGRKTLLATRIV